MENLFVWKHSVIWRFLEKESFVSGKMRCIKFKTSNKELCKYGCKTRCNQAYHIIITKLAFLSINATLNNHWMVVVKLIFQLSLNTFSAKIFKAHETGKSPTLSLTVKLCRYIIALKACWAITKCSKSKVVPKTGMLFEERKLCVIMNKCGFSLKQSQYNIRFKWYIHIQVIDLCI